MDQKAVKRPFTQSLPSSPNRSWPVTYESSLALRIWQWEQKFTDVSLKNFHLTLVSRVNLEIVISKYLQKMFDLPRKVVRNNRSYSLSDRPIFWRGMLSVTLWLITWAKAIINVKQRVNFKFNFFGLAHANRLISFVVMLLSQVAFVVSDMWAVGRF